MHADGLGSQGSGMNIVARKPAQQPIRLRMYLFHFQASTTALMHAVSSNRALTVKLLLEAGADINMKDESGRTALMWAVERGHTDIVELLQGKPECNVSIPVRNDLLLLR